MQSNCAMIFPSNSVNSFVRDPSVDVQTLEEEMNMLKNAQDLAIACRDIPHSLTVRWYADAREGA